MIRSTLATVLFASTSLLGCATDSTRGETTDENQDVQIGDRVVDPDTYYLARAEVRPCGSDGPEICGTSFNVTLLNSQSTKCVDGSLQEHCEVAVLDFALTGIPQGVAREYQNRIVLGEALVLKGELEATEGSSMLKVEEVWQPGSQSGSLASDEFHLVVDNLTRCIQAPCPSLTEVSLNEGHLGTLTELDLSTSGASEEQIAIGEQALFGPGVIVVGPAHVTDDGGRTRAVGQFFTKAPEPQI